MEPEAIKCLCIHPATCLPEDGLRHPSSSQMMRLGTTTYVRLAKTSKYRASLMPRLPWKRYCFPRNQRQWSRQDKRSTMRIHMSQKGTKFKDANRIPLGSPPCGYDSGYDLFVSTSCLALFRDSFSSSSSWYSEVTAWERGSLADRRLVSVIFNTRLECFWKGF